MQNINYPVRFLFHVGTLSNDFTAFDATGQTIAYVRQKMFKLKEDIIIYDSQEKTQINYRIKADRWLDFSAAYTFYDETGQDFGKIVRKGWRSIWKASYEIIDQYQMWQQIFGTASRHLWLGYPEKSMLAGILSENGADLLAQAF